MTYDQIYMFIHFSRGMRNYVLVYRGRVSQNLDEIFLSGITWIFFVPKFTKNKAEPKPRGRPRKEETASVVEQPPPPTDEQLRDYIRQLLHAYAAHAQLRSREAKRAHYRENFSRAFK